jgi:hypothetical protein
MASKMNRALFLAVLCVQTLSIFAAVRLAGLSSDRLLTEIDTELRREFVCGPGEDPGSPS